MTTKTRPPAPPAAREPGDEAPDFTGRFDDLVAALLSPPPVRPSPPSAARASRDADDRPR